MRPWKYPLNSTYEAYGNCYSYDLMGMWHKIAGNGLRPTDKSTGFLTKYWYSHSIEGPGQGSKGQQSTSLQGRTGRKEICDTIDKGMLLDNATNTYLLYSHFHIFPLTGSPALLKVRVNQNRNQHRPLFREILYAGNIHSNYPP